MVKRPRMHSSPSRPEYKPDLANLEILISHSVKEPFGPSAATSNCGPVQEERIASGSRFPLVLRKLFNCIPFGKPCSEDPTTLLFMEAKRVTSACYPKPAAR